MEGKYIDCVEEVRKLFAMASELDKYVVLCGDSNTYFHIVKVDDKVSRMIYSQVPYFNIEYDKIITVNGEYCSINIAVNTETATISYKDLACVRMVTKEELENKIKGML